MLPIGPMKASYALALGPVACLAVASGELPQLQDLEVGVNVLFV